MTSEPGEGDDGRRRPPPAAERAHERHADRIAESDAPLSAMSTDILKAVVLLNGGAAAATILFVGEIVRQPDLRPMAAWLVLPLALFGFGLTVAACATGFAYFARSSDRDAARAMRLASDPPYVVDTALSAQAATAAERYRRAGLGAVFASIASAILGFVIAGLVLLAHLRP